MKKIITFKFVKQIFTACLVVCGCLTYVCMMAMFCDLEFYDSLVYNIMAYIGVYGSACVSLAFVSYILLYKAYKGFKTYFSNN